MMRALALDDEPPALRVLTHFCAKIPFLKLEQTFTRPDEALHYLHQSPVDLLFLDVNMPAVSGLDFCRALPRQLMVIFTTAYSEHAVEGFELNAVDYLLKPFTLERFTQAVGKVRDLHQLRQQAQTPPAPAAPTHLYLRADYRLHQLALADILYVQGLDDYLKIHLQHARPLVVRLTMKALLAQLPAADFVRVHRSYIVPLRRVEHVRNKVLKLAGEEIPLGANYEADFLRRFGQ